MLQLKVLLLIVCCGPSFGKSVIREPEGVDASNLEFVMNDINPGDCALVVMDGDWKKTILDNHYGISGIEECCALCDEKKHCAKYSFHIKKRQCRLFTKDAIPKKRKRYLRSPGISCDLYCDGLPTSEVCGADGVTYDNACLLGEAGCVAGTAIPEICADTCEICGYVPPLDCGRIGYEDNGACKCDFDDEECTPSNCEGGQGCKQCLATIDCSSDSDVACEDRFFFARSLCYCLSSDKGDGLCGGTGDIAPLDAAFSYENCDDCPCFSAHSLLTIIEDGHPKSIYIKDARNGDLVLAFDDSGMLFYDEIFYRIHTIERTGRDYKTTLMKLWHTDGHIELSGAHLLYVTSKTLKTADHCIPIGNETACVHRADEVSVGDIIWEIDNHEENGADFKPQKILWITHVEAQFRGVLTLNGNVVVNGMAASAHIVHHNYNHFVSSPLRFIYRFVSKDAPNNPFIDYLYDDGIQSVRACGYDIMKYYEENDGNFFGYLILAVCVFTFGRSGIRYVLK